MQLIFNKQARQEYEIERTFTAGIVLSGAEVKSLRQKHGSLAGSYVKIIDGEAVLLNAQINPYAFADNKNYDPKQTRKLLLKKKELEELSELHLNKKKSLFPVSIDVLGRYIKVIVGVGRGLKHFDKRRKLKERDQTRDLQRQMKQRWNA